MVVITFIKGTATKMQLRIAEEYCKEGAVVKETSSGAVGTASLDFIGYLMIL
jgi:hypothetical protein